MRLKRVGRVLLVAVTAVGLLAVPATSRAATGPVLGGGGNIAVQPAPYSSSGVMYWVAPGTQLSFGCYATGSAVTGPYGPSSVWDELDSGGFVPDAWVYTGHSSPVVPPCPVGGTSFRVAFTGGSTTAHGSPSVSSPSAGPTLGDGAVVNVLCETTGDSVTDSQGFTLNIWELLSNGTYLANAYVYTGVNSFTPGMPLCSAGGSTPPPAADKSYKVAFTGGIGVYPRTGTSMSSPRASAAVAEGRYVAVACETYGDYVTDTAGYTNNIWDQLTTGSFIANVYLYTGTNGRTPGLPDCVGGSPGGGQPGGNTPVAAARPTGDIPTPAHPMDQLEHGTRQLPEPPLLQSLDQQFGALLAMCWARRFDNCYNMGAHWRAASGSPVTLPMSDMFASMANLRGQFKYWLIDNVHRYLGQAEATTPSGSARLCFDTASWATNCSTTANPSSWTSFYVGDINNDWQWTLGTFQIRMLGDVWVGPADASGDRPLQIRYRSFMYDVYNFNKPPFAQFESLASGGLAADFYETGSSRTVYVSGTTNSFNANAMQLSW